MTPHVFDLHAHSWFSDGQLSPTALMERAASNGAECIALTDHDTLAGLQEAAQAAQQYGIHFIPGVEFSTSWHGTTLHILGLNIQASSTFLNYAIETNQTTRIERAQKIALELEKAGFPHAWEKTQRYARSIDCITRTHFAQFLMEHKVAPSLKGVYRHYLLPGKPGYVETTWISLSDTIRAIQEANGLAVLAHPGRYSLSNAARRRLLDEFAALGGHGIEVMTPNHSPEHIRYFSEQCIRLGLKASAGSDFHSTEESRIDIGRIYSPPSHLSMIWDNWFPH
jgi:3',5'-nucleoside bisphosphate phosphatase